ncbi:TonB-dependent receptor [Chitinophagaceae bacterium 26-R-25]|nr:TonB-dependent receptor [Chitinophagaceae bacterium 26-R-25]
MFLMKNHQAFVANVLSMMLLLAASQRSAFAQKQNDSTRHSQDSIKIRVLEEVTVRSKMLLQNKSVTPVQSLKGEALQNMNSLSVADAIRYFSGVQLKDYGGIGGLKTVDTRSLGSNHTGVFYDGVQLGNAQNGQVDLGKFSLDNMEEISLYNAQRSEIFQPAKAFASAASIYLQSRTPEFGKEKYRVKTAIKTGSFGLFDPAVLWEQKISRNISSSFSGEWINANGKYKFRYTNGTYDTTAVRENADINAWRAEAGLYGMLKDSSKWRVKGYFYDASRGLPGAVVANKFSRGQRQWDRNFFLQAFYCNNVNKRFNYLFNVKYANDYMRYLDPDFVTTAGYLDNRYKQQEIYFSFANQYKIAKWWNVAMSGDFQWNKLDANLYRFAYPTRYQGLVSVATDLHFNNVVVQGGALQTMVWDKVEEYESAGNKQKLTPFLSASWKPFAKSNLRVRGFYKSIFRLPTFNDLYYTFIGNTSLRPEYTKQYDLGFTWSKAANTNPVFIQLQVDGYYNTVTDKIVAVPTTNLYRWMMLNLGKVEVHGIDASLETSWKCFQQLVVNATIKYTYQHAVDITPDADNYNQQIPYVPLNSGSAIVNMLWKTWCFNYSFIYSGERYSQKMNIPVNYVQPWYTHDLSLSKKFSCKHFNGKLLLEVNNVFNQYYDVVLNFPMPGRYWRVGAEIGIRN